MKWINFLEREPNELSQGQKQCMCIVQRVGLFNVFRLKTELTSKGFLLMLLSGFRFADAQKIDMMIERELWL